ncbi:LysM peptidoglycan-binding domain-containing protein [Mycobacterium sp. OTB74]|uniref:LysM peptidoglycan-binding domain-containing protein n=1 Tax=Mycobacterium sp. OTB74 TaxID=1853452 RepID=UPI0024751B74|nr:LysM peptidoglycan-binding domain-containing protein [Mycobacterium sp. OTB74]MDH6246718.1 hypothetical protein [Mycobacterium sp. OTB74]
MAIITREYPTDVVVRTVRQRQDMLRAQRSRRRSGQQRPLTGRPPGTAFRHRGTGVLMSRASHRPRPITPFTTVMLALLAAGITVWLGLIAQFGSAAQPAAAVPGDLAVVRVQSGESIQQVARRVAPDAPVGAVVERIRELNKLPSVALDAGQTLIAPVG